MWPSIPPRNPPRFAAPGVPSVLLRAVLASLLLTGCTTQDIVVSEAALTDSPENRVVGWTADESPRQVFSPEDEEVTLRALFEFNYRGVYEWYKVEWIAPDGSPYKVVTLRTDFASHRDITASLKIRGKMASRLPGLWRARLWLRGREGAPDRLLVSRLFRIAEPTPELLAAGLTPVDEPRPSAQRPLASASSAVPAAGAVAAVPGPEPGEVLLPPLLVLMEPPGDAAVSPAPPGTGGDVAAAGEQDAQAQAQAPASGSGVVSVSLTSTPVDEEARRREAVPRDFPGCPPLYYPPGPGCIEQAPEE